MTLYVNMYVSFCVYINLNSTVNFTILLSAHRIILHQRAIELMEVLCEVQLSYPLANDYQSTHSLPSVMYYPFEELKAGRFRSLVHYLISLIYSTVCRAPKMK